LPEASRVTGNGNTFTIEGGTVGSGNLFHSFSEFSLPTGLEAHFNNSLEIQNIFTRVTGAKISNIDGLIRANGTANLFFLNPNGIIFGPNARLQIGGSFFTSSAESLLFDSGAEFSASNPTETPLLTLRVPVGLQMGSNPGEIQVNGAGISDTLPTDNLGLSVAPGQTLGFIGGNVTFSGGIATAPSGRIEVGSLRNGIAEIVPLPLGYKLQYDALASEFQDIQLLAGASLFSPSLFVNPDSEIQITGRSLNLNASQIASVTSQEANGTPINIRTSESVQMGGTLNTIFPYSSWIVTQVGENATGSGGDIAIASPKIALSDGAKIQTISEGSGNAGNIAIAAPESLEIIGFAIPPNLVTDPTQITNEILFAQYTNSRISSENYASGAGGNVRVSTGNLTAGGGGQIATLVGVDATGKGGEITVDADTIAADGVLFFNPIAFSGIGSYTLGNGVGGDVNLVARQVNLNNGAEIFSWSQGTQPGGNLRANISESFVATEVNPLAPLLFSGLVTYTIGEANSGNLELSADRISLLNGGKIATVALITQLSNNPTSQVPAGNSGDVTVTADTIQLSSTSFLQPESSSLIATIMLGSGNAGDVSVVTRQLSITEGATVASSSVASFLGLGLPLPGAGSGNGGNVTVQASELIEVLGENPFYPQNSFLGALSVGTGNTGNVFVSSPRILLKDGGSIFSSTTATGNSGQLRVEAGDIRIEGVTPRGTVSQLGANAIVFPEEFQQIYFLPALPTGNTGTVIVNADRITLSDGGTLSVQHPGTGNAGTLQVNVDRLTLDRGGNINATTAFGFGGNVELHVADSLQLSNGSQITVAALGDLGDGGNLQIDSDTIAALSQSQISANAVGGNGGNINIRTDGLFLSPNSQITASSQFGLDGEIAIKTPDATSADGLVDLSAEFSDPSGQIVAGCAADEGNQLIVTGRGGLPEDPTQPFMGSTIWHDLRPVPNLADLDKLSDRSSLPQPSQQRDRTPPVVEAKGWTRNSQGHLVLTAASPNPDLFIPHFCR
jgi:filamentous hemagglutinin family protein